MAARLLRSVVNRTKEEKELALRRLLEALKDPNINVRTEVAVTLGILADPMAASPLLESLEGKDVGYSYKWTVLSALAAIGDSRAATFIEKYAQPGNWEEPRSTAINWLIRLRKPADPVQFARSFREQPTTDLEKQALSQRAEALPLIWAALADGTKEERRHAAALLGWIRSVDSIPHLVKALSSVPGALTRKQLLFDLSIILLTEGREIADGKDRAELAALHLKNLLGDLAENSEIQSHIREGMLKQKKILVYPGRLAHNFQLEVSRRSNTPLIVKVAPSVQRFQEWVKTGWGFHFHVFKMAGGLARVATTALHSGGGFTWIGLYQKREGVWDTFAFEPYDGRPYPGHEANLFSPFEKDYGSDDPLKIMRLDLLMERIRTSTNFPDLRENADIPGEGREFDESYVPLLKRYTNSDSVMIRCTAEYELARITGKPNIPFMLSVIKKEKNWAVLEPAYHSLSDYMFKNFEREGRLATKPERDVIVAVALNPRRYYAPELPTPLPKEHDIKRVRVWRNFALVDVSFGHQGYALLLERAKNGWRYVSTIRAWIA